MDSRVADGLLSTAPAAMRRAAKPADFYVLNPRNDRASAGMKVADFGSYSDFSRAIAAATIPPGVHWVMYDNERWQRTPVREQQNPAEFETLFAKLAHQHGYKVILAPAQDLVFGLAQQGDQAAGTPWQNYLDFHLAAISARLADIYEIQAQSDEMARYRSSAAYLDFVRAAAAQARAASSHVVIFAGLSTARVSNATELDQDYSSTRSLVSGYWLNVPASDPTGASIAAAFLNGAPSAASSCSATGS